MKKMVLLVLGTLVVIGLGFAEGRGESANEVSEAILAVFEEYEIAIETADSPRFLALHEMAAVKMPQNRPMFTIEDVAPNHATAFAALAATETVMEINSQEVVLAGEFAWAMGTYTVHDRHKETGAETFFDGKFLTIFRRQSDGRWLIYRHAYNSNTPPA